MTTLDALKDKLWLVASLRESLSSAKVAESVAFQALEATKEFRDYTDAQMQRKELETILREAEAQARQDAERIYEQTGNKHPVSGANVRVSKAFVYDEQEATKWCRTYAIGLLKLDRAAFERANIPGSGIEQIEKPVGTIASDLSEYLR